MHENDGGGSKPMDPKGKAAMTRARPEAPRAPHFIVTIYGDVVEPRGGTVWMGTLIEACAEHGISESLVRTAVSRLVGAGQLDGVRIGRKSYYRLSDAAQTGFAAASRILFDPPPPPDRWLIAMPGSALGSDLRFPWVRIGSGVALAPEWQDLMAPDGAVFEARSLCGDIAALASQHWALNDVAAAYHLVLERFGNTPDPDSMSGREALSLRLRLVDDYRRAALSDPRLPRSALPADWPAEAARALFVRIYCALSPVADHCVSSLFRDQNGPLPETTPATVHRLGRLQIECGAT
ncbi:PaaX family transcriptional regulator C-terminal domain-containing protein [Primorskyibacter sp. 2E107]|uniref:PaaX family transcriptional regulator C-terminal domain-containing protein n=1 Tax=Primorskyibacter sp. 2E107 TaxID=3403458 RepID=UPI003AF6ED53